MRAPRTVLTPLLLLLLVGPAAGCSGSDGGGDDGGGAADEAATTSTTGAAPEEASANFRVRGTLDAFGSRTEIEADVVDPSTYSLRFSAAGFFAEERRIGDRFWTRSSSSAGAADEVLWVEDDADLATAVATVEDAAASIPEDELGFMTGTDVVGDALVELLVTDPGALVEIAELDGDSSRLEPPLPETLADVLDTVGIDPPELELDVTVDGKHLTEAELEVTSEGSAYQVDVTYSDHGEVTEDDVPAPADAEIDATPWLSEEALPSFAETRLVHLATPPAGLVLVAAVVLDPVNTVEGCPQVELDYDVAPPSPPGDRFLTLYLLSKVCANAFDPTPFDETTAGFPSRYDDSELLVGSTVVQVLPSDALRRDRIAFAEALASLSPVDAATLIAAVVPADS